MKKLFVFGAIAAAAWGAIKLLRGKDEEQEFGSTETYAPPTEA